MSKSIKVVVKRKGEDAAKLWRALLTDPEVKEPADLQ